MPDPHSIALDAFLAAVRKALAEARGLENPESLAQRFDGASALQVEALLVALEAAGTALQFDDGGWMGV